MTEGPIFWIIAFVVGVAIIAALKNKLARSNSVVVTGPGVTKIHNIECKFRSEGGGRDIYHGKLSQDRWSDGQERFSLRLHKLPAHDGKIFLHRGSKLISEFDAKGSNVQFAWKGISSDTIPLFEIGEQLVIIVGSQKLAGTVEAD